MIRRPPRSTPLPLHDALPIWVRHSTEEPAPVEKLRPEVPGAVAEIVRQLMAKYPAERFQTPSELAAALAPFAVSGPTLWVIPPSGGPFSELRATPAASQTPAPVPHSDPLDT